ncbi:AT-rich interactive domain-containing protein 5 isoform X2 [Tripterygium wilfordii]|uniref:AT-rich interactive domain-containing protein 5 isoform X2 n=1 Tax=Tripterygium wilfordii TaxID=458696 RepID=A0A7J7DLP6_TRIWF|nr:AT-rich interactive domain-containing protein 6-like isoform X2 [Tripterygium wilfordii]KAF5747261.1 AT-rich interactive domain-containing protein 5 isoform X2 [Tripterygium wilfordii]
MTGTKDSVDAAPVDANIELQGSVPVPEEEKPNGTMQANFLATAEAKVLTSPNDADADIKKVLPDDKVSAGLSAGGVTDGEERGKKRKFDDTHAENQTEDATPLQIVLAGESAASKAEDENIGKLKNKWTDIEMGEINETDTPEEQAEFMKELATFYRENALDFKPPKFYGEYLNCLKLWRAVIRLGGYDLVTANKLWRQVGESFHPPKTCTTVSWTFRNFYEKALLEYERRKRQSGELQLPISSPLAHPTSVENEGSGSHGQGSGRARRNAATRAMEGWHTHRLLGHGEVSEPIIKEKSSAPRREKQLKNIGSSKQTHVEHAVIVAQDKQLVTEVTDVGPAADWVKINVRETNDSFEIYALVPGLLREEVQVQSDPAGRLVISGRPEQLDNPWGITPFKKIVNLPSRINPHYTSAVVSLHGRLYIRVPFERGSV